MTKATQKTVDNVIQNLVLKGLSLEQLGKLPKWLLENIEKNQSVIADAINQAQIETLEAVPLRQETNEWDAVDILTEAIDYRKKELIKLKETKT